jgi:hypothetical protein
MITISRMARFVLYPGETVFVEEKDEFPHVSMTPCFDPQGEGASGQCWCRGCERQGGVLSL